MVKTRLQVSGQGQTVFVLLKQISEREGVLGLFRGLGPRLFIYMTQGAIFFAAYELLKASQVSQAFKRPIRLPVRPVKLIVSLFVGGLESQLALPFAPLRAV